MRTKEIPLDDIRLDGETQPREKINQETVDRYADDLTEGDVFPPAVVYHDGSVYWLADGFHRWHANRKAGFGTMRCEVRQGSVEDARWFACSKDANGRHGLAMSNADKRRAVVRALSLPQGGEKSDRQIGEHTGVTAPTVAKYRAELTSTVKVLQSDARVGADGRKIKTANIGRKKAAGLAEVPGRTLVPADGIMYADQNGYAAGKPSGGVTFDPSEWDDPSAAEPAPEAGPRTAEDFYDGEPIAGPWVCPTPKEAAKPLDLAIRLLGEWEKSVLENVVASDEPGTAFFDERARSGFQVVVENLRGMLKTARPYAVCPLCKGDRCRECRNSGLVPKRLHEMLSARAAG